MPAKRTTKAARPELLAALKAENEKLHLKIAKLEAEIISAKSRVKALEDLYPEANPLLLSDARLTAIALGKDRKKR